MNLVPQKNDETEIFSSVILETLTTAEDQLANKEIDCERVRCAINDLKSLLVPVMKHRFSQRRQGFKHDVETYHPMLQRQALFWLKHLRRRMATKCSVNVREYPEYLSVLVLPIN